MFLATMLAFASVDGESITVWDAEEGAPYVIAAVTAIVAGGLLWFMSGATGRKVISIIALLIIGFFGLYAGIVDSSEIGDLGLDVGMGLWLMIAGSVVAVIGSVMALTGKGSGAGTAPTV